MSVDGGRGRALIVVAVASLLIAALLVRSSSSSPTDRPPAGHDEARHPLGRPPVVTGSGGYRFFWTQPHSAQPVTWDPCRPVHYVLKGTAPAGAERLLDDGIEALHEATGLRLHRDADTDEPLVHGRAGYQPGRYGRRWAPLLIAWSDPLETPEFTGSWIGLTTPQVVAGASGRLTIVTGIIRFDRNKFAANLAHDEPSQALAMRAVVLHELAHAVGLGHVDDPRDVMYPSTRGGVTAWGSGDLRGLAAVGRGRCAPDL